MAEEEVARFVVGNDSGTYKAGFAGDDSRADAVLVDTGLYHQIARPVLTHAPRSLTCVPVFSVLNVQAQ